MSNLYATTKHSAHNLNNKHGECASKNIVSTFLIVSEKMSGEPNTETKTVKTNLLTSV